jgi:hypothetical protein
MKCPYAVNRKVVTQTSMQYDENGCQTSYTEYQNNQAEFVNCLEEECGAYNKETGKCEYKC